MDVLSQIYSPKGDQNAKAKKKKKKPTAIS